MIDNEEWNLSDDDGWRRLSNAAEAEIEATLFGQIIGGRIMTKEEEDKTLQYWKERYFDLANLTDKWKATKLGEVDSLRDQIKFIDAELTLLRSRQRKIEKDLLWHARNYRRASSLHADNMFIELQVFVKNLVLTATRVGRDSILSNSNPKTP